MILNPRRLKGIVCLLSVTILASCSQPAGSATVSPTTGAISSPLASPLLPTLVPPTKVANTGSVTGRLEELSQPFAGGILYLAVVTKEANGVETAARLERETSARAITDAAGNFTFYNVKPGRYAIVVDTVRDAYMLRKPNNAGDMIFDVAADQTLDLGTLSYDKLPR